ncbi:DNA-deoxyinosine glycosylase [Roseburia hominis]
MNESQFVKHEISPVYDETSRILILGSFPSVKSRENKFFYGHPQNRFWKVLAQLLEEPLPLTIEEKKSLLLSHHIALWDVVDSCEITGSSDSSIRNVTPSDLTRITTASPIRHIYTNGGTADKLYCKYCFPMTQMAAIRLPSTSPANAAWSLERLLGEWRVILPDLVIE